MPWFEHPSIDEAYLELENVEDSEQIADRLHQLILELDEEYDSISTELTDESNKMTRELRQLSDLLFVGLLNTNANNEIGRVESMNLMLDMNIINHMITDFRVDWTLDNDLYPMKDKFSQERSDYMNDIIESSKPKTTIYPNPVQNTLTIDTEYKYKMLAADNRFTTTAWGSWSNQEVPEFDQFSDLPKLTEQWFDGSRNSAITAGSIKYTIYDMNWWEVWKTSWSLDSNWNIRAQYDCSSLVAWTYTMKIDFPSIDNSSLQRAEEIEWVNYRDWSTTIKFIKQ